MVYESYIRWLIRSCMVASVTGLIMLLLYSPSIINMLRPKKSITVLAWAQVLDTSFLRDFERETGVKVYIRYFESNEEVLVKLEASDNHGYDLIMPSDFAAELLIKKGLIKPLEKNKLNFLSHIYPDLLDHYYDPKNAYTIPFFWGALVLGVDLDYFKGVKPKASWDLIFNKDVAPDQIGLLDASRELTMLAAYYLFQKTDNLTVDQIESIKELLKEQKEWVQIYTEIRAEYLLSSKSCPVALIFSSDIVKVMREFSYIDFVVPSEGTFAVIDSFAIPATSKNDEAIYQFLNYLYRPDVLQKYVDKFGFYPPTKNVRPVFIREGISIAPDVMLDGAQFFKNVVPENVLNDIWISLKA